MAQLRSESPQPRDLSRKRVQEVALKWIQDSGSTDGLNKKHAADQHRCDGT
jgi:hypothetical protein